MPPVINTPSKRWQQHLPYYFVSSTREQIPKGPNHSLISRAHSGPNFVVTSTIKTLSGTLHHQKFDFFWGSTLSIIDLKAFESQLFNKSASQCRGFTWLLYSSDSLNFSLVLDIWKSAIHHKRNIKYPLWIPPSQTNKSSKMPTTANFPNKAAPGVRFPTMRSKLSLTKN